MTGVASDFTQYLYTTLYDDGYDLLPTDAESDREFYVTLAGRRLRVTVTNEQEPS